MLISPRPKTVATWMLMVVSLAVVACDNNQQLPDIDATVEARVEMAKASLEAPTALPLPTYTPAPPLPRAATPMAAAKSAPAVPAAPAMPPPLPPTPHVVIKEVVKEVTVVTRVDVPVIIIATPTPIPTATSVPPTSPTPTSTPMPTPNPLSPKISITHLPIWDYRGTPDWTISGESPPNVLEANYSRLENCFDFELTNQNDRSIRFAYNLKAFDDEGTSYEHDVAHRGNQLASEHLTPGQTYFDRRCWRSPATGVEFVNHPVSRMEATLGYAEVSTLMVFVGWQQIGTGGVHLTDIKLNSEPSVYEGYPNVNENDMTTLTVKAKWQVENLSDSKTYRIKACTAYKWKDAEMFKLPAYTLTTKHADKIKPGALFDTVCSSIDGELLGPGKLMDIWAMQSFSGEAYRYSLYLEPLGIWVKQE